MPFELSAVAGVVVSVAARQAEVVNRVRVVFEVEMS